MSIQALNSIDNSISKWKAKAKNHKYYFELAESEIKKLEKERSVIVDRMDGLSDI